jgi:deoxyribonuclease V
MDVGFEDHDRIIRAAVAVLRCRDLQLVESALARRPTRFPYVPGLLSFREIPAALGALAALTCPPDLLLCDGQGLAHRRRFGLACHLGWLVDVPTIGVAKSRLLGNFTPPPAEHGAWSPLWDRGELVGAAVRTRRSVKPLFVSPGHRVDVASAVRLTLACTDRYRLPEPSRTAHRLASNA